MFTQLRDLAVVVVVLSVAAPACAAPGDLDPSFGEGGHVLVQANASCQGLGGCVEFGGSYADALALEPDGGIVIGGSENYILAPRPRSGEAPAGALVRLLPNGALDTSFGSEGIEDTPFSVDHIETNALGGLVVTGGIEAGKIGIARYTSAGVLDGSFAPQGVRWIPQPDGSDGERRDAKGRIVFLAALTKVTVAVVRYLPSGALDPSFGHGGYAGVYVPKTRREAAIRPGFLTPPEVRPMAFAVQPDGDVLVALAVASYEPSGEPNVNGEPTGSLYGKPRYFLERLSSNGRLDRTFGSDGTVRLPEEMHKIAVAPNGHILLAAAESKEGALQPGSRRLLLVNFTPRGRLDQAFGADGIARSHPIVTNSRVGVDPRAIAFDSKGDAIVVGELPERTVDVPVGTGFLARYTPKGLDCSFGTDGVVIDDEMGGASAVIVQPNGRIVVAGWSRNAFMAARYMGGGNPQTCP